MFVDRLFKEGSTASSLKVAHPLHEKDVVSATVMLRNDVKFPRISRAEQLEHEKETVLNDKDVSAGK